MERRKAGDGSLSCPITTALTASNGVNRDHEEMSRAERIHGFIGRPAPSRRSTHSPGRGHWVYLMRLGLQNHECKLQRTYQHSSAGECKTSKCHFAKIGPASGKLGFERHPPRVGPRCAHCIPFEILDITHIFSGISSGGHYDVRRPSYREVTGTVQVRWDDSDGGVLTLLP